MSLVPITDSAPLFPPFLLSFKLHLLFQSVGFLRPRRCSCLCSCCLCCLLACFAFSIFSIFLPLSLPPLSWDTITALVQDVNRKNDFAPVSAESNIDVSQPTPPLINSWKSMSWLSLPASPQRWNALSSWKSGPGVRWFWRFVNLFAPSETISQQSASSIVI